MTAPLAFLRPLWRLLACLTLLAAGSSAFASSLVIVGRVDTATQYLRYEMTEVYISSFADGTPITRLQLGYSSVSKAYYFLRAGTTASGGCRTEVFRLVKLADNRLAVADPANPNIAWGVKQPWPKIRATFDCTSTSCPHCNPVSDDSLDFDVPRCQCQGGTAGCKPRAPGTGGPYGPYDLVTVLQ